MSGGMNQRIAIAAAMLLSPKLLICDEATSALDVTTAQLVMDELLQMRRDLGTGILMVTHNLGIAKHMADRIAIMYQGELVEIGPCQDVIGHPQHAYTKQLLESAPRMSA
jgi:ABC-type dipeptide/oligopeptide/nickel transport system ATPase component